MPEDPRQLAERLLAALGQTTTGPTVAELWPEFLAHIKGTLSSWRDDVSRWKVVERYWGPLRVGEIGDANVDKYRALRLEQTTRRRKPPSPATLNREAMLVSRLLNFSVKRRRIAYNPLHSIAYLPENNTRHTKISGEEALAQLLTPAGPLERALILLFYDTGCRRMEGCRLRWDQIDPETLWVVVPHAKGGKPRRFRLSRRAWGALDELPRLCEFVFAHQQRKGGARVYSPSRLYRRFRACVKKSGLEGVAGEEIVLHTLRHSFAYVMRRRRKLSEKSIMRMGGWKTRVAFDRYGISDEEEIEEAWDRADSGLADELEGIHDTHRRGPRRIAPKCDNKPHATLDRGAQSGVEPKMPGQDEALGSSHRPS